MLPGASVAQGQMEAAIADGKPAKAAERQERLAAELRANLKKRKAQGRARQAPEAKPAEDQPPAGLAPAKTVR